VDEVVVTPGGAAISGVGAMQAFTAEARDVAGTVLTSVPVTWASLNPNVATIDESTGEATAVGNGQVTLAAEAGGVRGYAVLTVAVPGLEPVNLWSVMDSPTRAGLPGVWGTSSSDVFAVGGGGAILHYDGSTWTTMSNPDAGDLHAVWGTSSSHVYAVGSSILHYDGSVWSAMNAPEGGGDGVWGTSPRDVFAVGGGPILRYDGNSWSTMNNPTGESVADVWGFSSDDVYAVTWNATILHYDGSAWSTMDSPSSLFLSSVWGSSPNDVYAVGFGGLILHYDGSGWSTISSGPDLSVDGVWGSSSGDVYAVGDGGAIRYYDGSTWSTVDSPVTLPLAFVWASPNSDVYAVGDSGTILRGIRGGSVVVTSAAGALTALGDTVRLAAQAEDAAGNPVGGVSITSWNSSDEAVATVDTTGLVTAVSNGVATISATAPGGAAGSAEITIAQAAATVEVTPAGATIATSGATQLFTATAWDSTGNLIPGKTFTWSTLNTNVANIDPSTGIASPVGSGQVTVVAAADGAVGYGLLTVGVPVAEPVNLWSTMDTPVNVWLGDVWGTSSSDVFAVGGGGAILHFDGSAWTTMSNSDGGNLHAVWGTSSSNVYAAGGPILHYDGSDWSTMSSPAGGEGVWGTSPIDVYAVSDPGWILHYDGTAWSTMNSPTAAGIHDVWGLSADEVYAVGADGADAAILHYGGNTWSVVNRQSTGELYGIWGTSASDIYAVGHPSIILHYDGSAWSSMSNPEQYGAGDVWGTSSSDVYAADGSILHYDGAAWSIAMNRPSSGSVWHVWVSPDSDVFAVGDSGTIVRGYRGASVVVTPAADTITALGDTVRFAAQAQDAGGNPVSGVPLTLWSSSDLSVATVDTEGLVTAVSGGVATITVTAPGGASGSAEVTVNQLATAVEVTPGGATIATAGGTQAFAGIAWDATGHLIPGKTFTWSTLNSNIAAIDPSTGVASPVGSGQVTIVAAADGAVGYGLLTVAVPGMVPVNLWSVMESPTSMDLHGVWGTAVSDVYAVGNGGVILHYDGNVWSLMSNPEAEFLNAVWGSSSNDVYALGWPMLHYDGTAWSATSSPANDDVQGVWGSSPSDVFAVGRVGTIIHYDGSAWSVMSSPTLTGIDGPQIQWQRVECGEQAGHQSRFYLGHLSERCVRGGRRDLPL
jgi:uncharacterized protein YjdB